MSTDFERFINACKEWPTSSVVRERGLLVPTYLLETASNELRYGDFRVGRDDRAVAAALGELAFSLDTQPVTALGLISPGDRVPVGSDGALTSDPRFAGLGSYSEVLLLRAFAVDGATRTLLGLTNDYANGIEHWDDLGDQFMIRGAIGGPVAEIVSRWRDPNRSLLPSDECWETSAIA